MFDKIIAFFMAIIAFFSSLFGFGGSKEKFQYYENVKYGPYDRNYVDVAVPNGASGEVGLILEIHGGAWVYGDKSAYNSEVKTIARDFGYIGASMNYRYLSSETTMSDILDDISNCLSFIKAQLAQQGIEVNKCILTGMSAGAHLSMLYAYSRKDNSNVKPVAVVSFCGPTDFTDAEFLKSDIGTEETVLTLYSYAIGQNITNKQMLLNSEVYNKLVSCSPLSYASRAVPTVIAHGMKDTTVPYSNAVSLDKALTLNGIKHDFISYPNSNHSLSNDKDCADKAYQLFIQYAETYLK